MSNILPDQEPVSVLLTVVYQLTQGLYLNHACSGHWYINPCSTSHPTSQCWNLKKNRNQNILLWLPACVMEFGKHPMHKLLDLMLINSFFTSLVVTCKYGVATFGKVIPCKNVLLWLPSEHDGTKTQLLAT